MDTLKASGAGGHEHPRRKGHERRRREGVTKACGEKPEEAENTRGDRASAVSSDLSIATDRCPEQDPEGDGPMLRRHREIAGSSTAQNDRRGRIVERRLG
jgi:hypothetical protein